MRRKVSAARIRLILLAAVAMTVVAELFYLIIFGILLYPAGNLAAKVAWTVTCGIAMGAVIGAGVLLFAEPLASPRRRFASTMVVTVFVGSYCAWLCGRIDMSFNYFGGAEDPMLFLASGIFPAIVGGGIYAWLLHLAPIDARFGGRAPGSQHPAR